MGAVAAHLEPSPGLGRVVRPPPYRALREYEAGMVASGVDWDEARRRFENAVALAPDFWGAQLRLIMVYEAQGEGERQRALMSRLGDRQDAFSPFERLVFDLYQARAEDRRQDALRLTRLIRVEVPKDLFFAVLHAGMAMTERHPREVVDALGGIDDPGWTRLTRGPQGEWALKLLASARHLLGEHEQELEAAERGLRLYSASQDALQRKVRALAALGRVEEVERLVGVSQSTASEKMAAGEVALVAAQELRAHGRPDEARKLASRAADWYADLPAPDAGTDLSRWNRLESLWVAERWNEARVLAESFASREPSPRWSVLITGYRGALAARLGDERAAKAADAELAAVTERRLLGFAYYFRGAIAAHLGDRETAVERLRSAVAVGSVTLDWIHTFFCLEPLQGYPPFEELLAPQG
jgi:tetratricopeptide (TPR) repeat protein